MLQKSKRQAFLQTMPFFKDWTFVKLLDLNNYLNETKYQADEVIYDIGSDPEVIYILKSGRLVVETLIEVEDYNKYPVVSNL